MRKITSMTLLVSFVLLILNSVVLYIVPEGRVAYWADWRFWGLTKTEWGDQHVTVGFLFLLAGFLHLFYNWAAVVRYMNNKVKKISVFTMPFGVGLGLTALVAVMTYFHVPPVNFVLQLGSHFKETGAEKYGEPPYGHAERSSLKMFSQKEGIDLGRALELLQQAGVRDAGGEQTLLAVAQKNGLTPQQVFRIITPAKKTVAVNGTDHKATSPFPELPQPGFGRKTLEQVCAEWRLDYAQVVQGLQGKGLSVEAAKTIHEVAEANGKTPMELFEAVRDVAIGQKK